MGQNTSDATAEPPIGMSLYHAFSNAVGGGVTKPTGFQCSVENVIMGCRSPLYKPFTFKEFLMATHLCLSRMVSPSNYWSLRNTVIPKSDMCIENLLANHNLTLIINQKKETLATLEIHLTLRFYWNLTGNSYISRQIAVWAQIYSSQKSQTLLEMVGGVAGMKTVEDCWSV